MIRKISLFTAVIAVLSFLYFGYHQMKITQKPVVDLYTLVPTNAIIVLEIKQPLTQWNDLRSNNIIWDELQEFEGVVNLNQQITAIDSAIQLMDSRMKAPASIIISLVPDSQNTLQLVYQFLLPKPVKDHTFLEVLAKGTLNKLLFSNEKSFTINGPKQSLFGIITSEVASVSTSNEVLENIKNQIKSNNHLLQNLDFKKVKKTSSKNSDLRLFIEPNLLAFHIQHMGNPTVQSVLSKFPKTASWIEMDLDIKPDEINMNGFTTASDSMHYWVNLFKGQDPVKPRVVAFLPNKTAFMFHIGFSDFDRLRNKYVRSLTTESGDKWDQKILDWEYTYEISIQDEFLTWIDNEIALVVVEPEREDLTNEIMIWVSAIDSETMMKSLTHIALSVHNQSQTDFSFITYKGYQIHKLNIPSFLEKTLGEPFQSVTENYFMQLEDYVVFANSPATLQWSIDRFKNGKTLDKEEQYKSFTHRLTEVSNIHVYSNISVSPTIFKSLGSPWIKKEIENHQEWLENFQAVSLQVSYETDDLFFVNNYLRYNPITKKETNTLWELPLLTTATFKPVFVKNHYTQATEIFIQDEAHHIYLIDNKGHKLWQRTLDGPIISKVNQIDAFKNDKLQLLFNTAHTIYLIDRNGRDVNQFPISLTYMASASLFLADYEDNKDYRIIIPTINGDVLNFNSKGVPVKGWAYQKQSSYVSQPVQHIRIKNRDYIITISQNGKIKGLDRKGAIRLNLKSKFNAPLIGEVSIQVGSDLSHSFVIGVTTDKEAVQINLNDQYQPLFQFDSDSIQYIGFSDADDDGSIEIIATGTKSIKALKSDGSIVSNFSIRNQVSHPVSFYSFGKNKTIGYVSAAENKIILVDIKGEILKAFPIKGATPFSIGDINKDGRYNLITVDSEGVLLNYTLDL